VVKLDNLGRLKFSRPNQALPICFFRSSKWHALRCLPLCKPNHMRRFSDSLAIYRWSARTGGCSGFFLFFFSFMFLSLFYFFLFLFYFFFLFYFSCFFFISCFLFLFLFISCFLFFISFSCFFFYLYFLSNIIFSLSFFLSF
jgi:hypothetical protein